MSSIYVASSWRNTFQPEVVQVLRADGHEVYDFKDSEGFHWTEVDGGWQSWPSDIPKYLRGLDHPCAIRGFERDMNALIECDICVYVMPCGVSASLEAGWACGAGKRVIVYVPGLREPDLMVKMADAITSDLQAVRDFCAHGPRAYSRSGGLGMADLQQRIMDRFGGTTAIHRPPVEPETERHVFVAHTVGAHLKTPYCCACGAGLLHHVHMVEASH